MTIGNIRAVSRGRSLDLDAFEPVNAIHPGAFDRHLALKRHAEGGEEGNGGWEVVDDDADMVTWTRPWSFGMLLTRDPEAQVFENACHEGNEGMRNMLKVARGAEKR